jgi:hypothetical protein
METKPKTPETPKDCTCYGRWQCSACTLELLDRGEHERAAQTEISQSVRSILNHR